MKSLLRTVALLMFVCLMALVCKAQTSSGTVTGHVVDPSQSVVVGAQVDLVNQMTGVVTTTKVHSNGDFIFADVQPGTFTVIVKAKGFKEYRQVDLKLNASQVLSAGTLTLQLGEVSETVTVSAEITPLQSGSSERSGVLDNKQLENLLAIGRDAMALTRTLPGVVGGEGGSSLGTSSTPTVNGVNSEYNSATIDGVVGNTRGLSTLDTPINMDAVQEVTLLGSNYQAQYGKTAGANFNFVTRSGTNQFHGGLYYYFRNEDLNANSWVDKYLNNQPRPRYRFNTIGGTFGGPVVLPHFNGHDKLFFFVSLEYDPTTSPDGLKNYLIPTQAEINGDFSHTYQQGKSTPQLVYIRDPLLSGTCDTSKGGSACFAGNIIPAGRINKQMQAMMQVMYDNTLGKNPSFAQTNPALTQYNYNYQTNYSAYKPVNQEIFRVDYAPTSRIHMFGRGDLETVNNNDFSSPANSMPWLMRVNYKTTNPNFVYNIAYTFTPTLVNELNLGTAGWSETQLYDKADLAKVTLGANGVTLPSLYSGVNPMNLFPATSFGGTNAANFGWDSRFPMADQVRTYSLTDNVTKIIGNHTLKFGIDAQTDSYLQPNKNRVGKFDTTVNSSNPNNTNWGYSNALLGYLNTYSQTTQLHDYRPRTNAFEWYYQDTWKVNPKLVLDLGIRNSWAMAQRLHEGNNFVPSLYNPADAPLLYGFSANGANAVDPTTGTLYPKAYAGLLVPNTGNLNNGILYVNTAGFPQGTTYGNGILWAPRVGFAYSPNSKTVVRGGFGMFYNTRARSGQEGDLTNNAPTTNSPTQYYTNLNAGTPGYYAAAGASALNGPFSIGHALPLHAPQLYTEQGSLGIQRQIPWGMVVDIAYVGTFTKHASDYSPINEVPYNSEFLPEHQYISGLAANGKPTASSTLPDNFFRPYPGFNGINLQLFNLTANYNSLQTQVTRRFHNGLEFGLAYTYSKALDYGSCSSSGCTESYNFTAPLYQDVRAWSYGPSGYDRRHNLIVNYIWSLPRASKVWNNLASRTVLDGWQISGIASYVSGAPQTISLSVKTSTNITGGGDGARVVLTCDPMHGAPKNFNSWFNTGCVEAPIAGTVAHPDLYNSAGTAVVSKAVAAAPFSTGNGVFSPKVSYFLPGNGNFDTALFKNWSIENKATVQLRVETYNTFNHTQFNSVDDTAVFQNANQSSTNTQLSGTFGQKNGAQNPRYMQLALRVSF
jgi:hypothetical protein